MQNLRWELVWSRFFEHKFFFFFLGDAKFAMGVGLVEIFLTYFVKINLKNRDMSRFGGDFLLYLGKYLIKTRSNFLSM